MNLPIRRSGRRSIIIITKFTAHEPLRIRILSPSSSSTLVPFQFCSAFFSPFPFPFPRARHPSHNPPHLPKTPTRLKTTTTSHLPVSNPIPTSHLPLVLSLSPSQGNHKALHGSHFPISLFPPSAFFHPTIHPSYHPSSLFPPPLPDLRITLPNSLPSPSILPSLSFLYLSLPKACTTLSNSLHPNRALIWYSIARFSFTSPVSNPPFIPTLSHSLPKASTTPPPTPSLPLQHLNRPLIEHSITHVSSTPLSSTLPLFDPSTLSSPALLLKPYHTPQLTHSPLS